jgi:phenylalanyl-tRNA synthetase beta chain
MKISYSWLKEYINIDLDAETLGRKLTSTGLEVESIESYEEVEGSLEGLVVGEVITCEKHPNADKLKVATVDIGGSNQLPVICGAPNVKKGQKVVVAPVGTTLHHVSGESFEIKKTKIRGEVSEGMICAEDEIGLGNDHAGILVLDTDLRNGTPVKNYFKPFKDQVFEIGLTPNRADATSHIGVSRDIRAITEKEVHLPSVENFKVDNHDLPIEVLVENAEACPRYSGVTIKGVSIKESPRWLKNKLQSIGLSPINNVVDITNFVLHEFGQPLHAFDADQIRGNKVIVKTMPEGSKFVTLDEVERALLDTDLMICNALEGMCIAGVFGGIKSGVTEKTKNIFLESAYFSPDYIRRTAHYHELKTDASFRFERGTDPDVTVHALKRAAMLIKELAGGTISSEVVDVYPKKLLPFKVPVSFAHIDRLIGKSIPEDEIKRILKLLDITMTDESVKGFTALVPQYRVDVYREADVIEEILRIYGYDNIEIPTKIKSDFLAEFPLKDFEKVQSKISDLLSSVGFTEIMTNSFTTQKYSEAVPASKRGEDVDILNKLSEDLGVLRQTLLFTGLEVIAYNISHRQRNLKLFELGKSYAKSDDKYLEYNQLSLFMTGDSEAENWRSQTIPIEFHDLYEVIQKILYKFNIHEPELNFIQDEIIKEGVTLSIQGKVLVTFGWLSEAILEEINIKQDILYGNVDWDFFFELTTTEITFESVSKYPEVRRDLSLVIDKSITFNDILKIVKKFENKLVRNINVFDFYEGEKIDKNKKAYALSFILQDKSKTLSDKVIDKTMNHLIKLFENELGAIIRK